MKNRTNADWPIAAASIGGLPFYALVGFAARCARRIQPAILHACSGVSDARIEAIEDAISLAELAAGKHSKLPEDVNLVTDAAIAEDNAISVAVAARRSARELASIPQAALVIVAANSAALAADTVAAARAGDRDATSKTARDCAEIAGAVAPVGLRRDAIINAMLDDVDLLKEEHQRGTLQNSTLVPPQFFGPLWREGAPPGWPGAAG